MTLLIIAGAAIYLIVLLYALAYPTSGEYQGNRKTSNIFDIFWPVTYPCLLFYVGIVKSFGALTGYNE